MKNIIKRDYSTSDFLNAFSFKEELIDFQKQVIILPYKNFISKNTSFQNAFPDSSYFIKDAIEENELSIEFYDNKSERNDLVLRSADYIFPFLLILAEPAVSIVLNILSSIIYDRFIKGEKRNDIPELKIEYAIIDTERNITKFQSIEGKATEVKKVLCNDPYYKKLPKEIKYPTIKKQKGNLFVSESITEYKIAECLILEANTLYNNGLFEASETLYRKSLEKLCDAYLLNKAKIKYRKYLHEIGLLIYTKFQCIYKFEDEAYRLYCPVMKSHNKAGFSIGGVGKRICSICGEEFHKCIHKEKTYNNIIAERRDGRCSICGNTKCDHEVGKSYDNVIPIYITKDFKIDHVAFVQNPADPRMVYFNDVLEKEEIYKILTEDEKKEFKYGESVLYCTHCINCNGS